MVQKDLLRIVSNNRTLSGLLDMMADDGLIIIDVVLTPHRHKSIMLTDLGKDTAMMLSMVDVTVSPGKELTEKSLDMRHFDPLIRFMHGKGYVVQKDILELLPSYIPVMRVLDRMAEDGLAESYTPSENKREKRYRLTPLGERVAEIYATIHSRIEKNRRARRARKMFRQDHLLALVALLLPLLVASAPTVPGPELPTPIISVPFFFLAGLVATGIVPLAVLSAR